MANIIKYWLSNFFVKRNFIWLMVSFLCCTLPPPSSPYHCLGPISTINVIKCSKTNNKSVVGQTNWIYLFSNCCTFWRHTQNSVHRITKALSLSYSHLFLLSLAFEVFGWTIWIRTYNYYVLSNTMCAITQLIYDLLCQMIC